MKIQIVFFTSVLLSTIMDAQELPTLYRNMYKTADSLKVCGKMTYMDTNALFRRIRLVRREDYTGLVNVAADYIAHLKYNEAAFTFNLMLRRYQYYNNIHPGDLSEGGANIMPDLIYDISQLVTLYLRADIDNFIVSTKLMLAYLESNDCRRCHTTKCKAAYDSVIKPCYEVVADLELKKVQYGEQWAEERKSIQSAIEKAIEVDSSKNINSEH